jgi:integrase
LFGVSLFLRRITGSTTNSDFPFFFDQKPHKMHTKYTTPKLSKNQKGWYVHYRYEGKQFRETNGLNKIPDLKIREQEYEKLCRDILIELKSGWNPNIPDGVQNHADMFIIEALRFALEKKKPNVAKKTYSAYDGTINAIEKTVILAGSEYFKIVDTKRVHIKTIMENARQKYEWSNKGHNKHLNHLKALFSELVQWDIIEDNIAHNIKNLRVEETIAHTPPTDEQWERIKTELKKNHPNFYNYISVIFHLGIRPEEILKIRLSMVDMEKNIITLPPNITKNRKKYRILPINKHLKNDLESMNFRELPKDYFLFGSFKESGLGNRGNNQFLPDFVPGYTHTNRDTATRRWETIVKIGLKIDCTMYSVKKYGANKKASAGISTEAIQRIFGHSERETTMIYLTNQDEINLKEVMDKSPDL